MKTLVILAILTLTGCAVQTSDTSDGSGGGAPVSDSTHVVCEGTGPDGVSCMILPGGDQADYSVEVCEEGPTAKVVKACSFAPVGCCTLSGAAVCWPSDDDGYHANKCLDAGGTWQAASNG